jgi:tRNA threonylcarbamoyladenosine biosynthesis protein TsaB
VSIAIHDGREVVAESTWRTVNHHTVELPSAVADVLARAGVTAQRLQAIAVALGPGSYTGLRIGLSLAKGMALAAAPVIPLIGVPTLDIAAAAQPHQAFDRLCVVAQAGRGRVNAGLYEWLHHEWRNIEAPVTVSWAELGSRLQMPTQVSGEITPDGYEALAALGARVWIAPGAFALRRAGFLAQIAYDRLANGKVDDPATLSPIYLH